MATAAPAVPAGTLAETLGHAVVEAKAGNALAPVTVVTPTAHAAVWAGRAAVLELAAAGHPGLANVRISTTGGLVELLARPTLADLGVKAAGVAVERAVRRSTAASMTSPNETDVLDQVRERLRAHGLVDRVGLGHHAQAAARHETLPDELGPLVLVELAALSPGEEELLAVLATRLGSTTLGGDEARACTEVRPCATVGDEARAAVRAVLAGVESGVPLWRQAVLHDGRPGTARRLHQELAEAGLRSCGPGFQPLLRCAGGRGLLGLLDLRGHDFGRDAVTSWLASVASVRPGTAQPVPAERWDALSATAGVVAGLDQWHDRLGHLAASDGGDLEVPALRSFVDHLADALISPRPASWAAWAEWARALLADFLSGGAAEWPGDERQGLDQVDEALVELGQLDGLLEGPTPETFRAAIGGELAARTWESERLGPTAFGQGVFVAPYDQARGVRFDSVVLVGTRGEELRAGDVAVALRAGTRRRVATWLDDPGGSPRHLRRARGVGLVDPQSTAVRPLESMTGSRRGPGPALHLAEHTRRTLTRAVRQENLVGNGPLLVDPQLAAGIDAVLGRRGRTFSRFDGWVGRLAVNPFDPDRPLSATRLETYADCPRRFLFDRVLGARPRERPEESWRIEARARGSLVHAVLERYVQARIDGAPRTLDLLLSLAEDSFEEAGRRGPGGRPLLWRLEQAAIGRDLRHFYADESNDVPLAAELAFGSGETDDAPPVEVVLPDRRTLRMQGRIDRVDRAPDGAVVVSDYKTGRQAGLARLSADPLDGGRHLQLPLYGLAARGRFGGAGGVRARFWLISSERHAASYQVELSDELEAHFVDLVGALAGAVESGAFPAVPATGRGPGGFERCRWCDFDRVCPTSRPRHWATKRADPLLALVNRARDRPVPDVLAGAVAPAVLGPEVPT